VLDIPSISAMLAAIGVLVGVVFAILELRNLVRIRHTDLLLGLYSTYDSLEFLEAWQKIFLTGFKHYDAFVEKLVASDIQHRLS
jgi:hypothetical protein